MLFSKQLLITNIEWVYQVMCFILAFGLTIDAAEDVKNLSIFRSGGLLSWKVSRLQEKWSTKGFFANFLNNMLGEKFFVCSVYLRLVTSVCLLVLSWLGIISSTILLLELALLILIDLRSNYGLDGAHQMYVIVLFGLFIGSVFGIHSLASKCCLWFITAQLLLSYFIAGIFKLFSPLWQKGYALKMIFGTKVYGNTFIYKLINRRFPLALLFSWVIIITETCFFLIFFVDPQYIIYFIIGGILFHVGTAILMGLNDFLFAFATAYPALLYCLATLPLNWIRI